MGEDRQVHRVRQVGAGEVQPGSGPVPPSLRGPSLTAARAAGRLPGAEGPELTHSLDRVPEWHDPEAAELLQRAGQSRPSTPSLLGKMFGFEAQPGVPASWLLAGDVLAVGSLLAGCTVTALTLGPAGLLVTVAMEAMAAAAGGAMITPEDREKGRRTALLHRDRNPRTGLPGQAETLEILAGEYRECRQKRVPLAVLLLGVDRPGPVDEDEEAPPLEEGLLHQVALRAASALRSEDTLGPHGRDRLMAILPGLGAAPAAMVAERIRLAVASAPLEAEGEEVAATISIGVATTDLAPLAPLKDLVKKAAVALYRAGARGRNRVVVAGLS